MFKRISIVLLILFTLLAFTIGAGAVAPGLFVEKDAAGTYIDYVDAAGTSIMKIDDTEGVTIAIFVADNTYYSMTLTSVLDASSLTAGSFVTPGGIACAKGLFIGDDIDMSVSGTGVYDITLKDAVADALSIVGGSTDMIVFCTDTDAITITPPTTITGLLTSNGGITVGASDAGFDVTFYGDNAGSDFVWDQNGDTNIGTLTLGASTDYVDFIAYGATASTYLQWDGSADDLLLVGTGSQLAIAGTTTSTTTTTGSLRTAGGLGVVENANIGGTLKVTGVSTFSAGAIIGSAATGMDFTGTFTVAAISMDSATFVAGDNEIEMRNTVVGDKTVIASGAATNDGEIVTAVGADADIADGSLYISAVNGAGSLWIKKNDVWTAYTNP